MYGILNQETGNYLSKSNLLTCDSSEALRTNKEHAEWLLERFQNENEFLVELFKFQ